MIDVVGNRKWYFLISALITVPGLIALLLGGLKLGVDFTGGTLWELRFRNGAPQSEQLRSVFALANPPHPEAIIQVSGSDTLLVRLAQIEEGSGEKAALATELRGRFGEFDERFDSVGPAVGREIAERALLAVALSSLGILSYIWLAFRNIPNAVRYGVCAVLAMIHDAVVVVGMFALLGLLFGWEVDGLFVTALLTVIGFSVHDTIVVFDRIRENMNRRTGEPFSTVVNHSLVQTLARSLNTSLTVVITLVALVLFGGATIRSFTVALLIGIVSGTFSSIFFASMLLVVWSNGELARLFGRQPRAETAEAASPRRPVATGAKR